MHDFPKRGRTNRRAFEYHNQIPDRRSHEIRDHGESHEIKGGETQNAHRHQVKKLNFGPLKMLDE